MTFWREKNQVLNALLEEYQLKASHVLNAFHFIRSLGVCLGCTLKVRCGSCATAPNNASRQSWLPARVQDR